MSSAAAKQRGRTSKPDRSAEITAAEFGDRMRAARRRRELTLREVSEATGISITYLSDLERGVLANPTLDKLVGIARSLGVSVDELLGEPGREEGTGEAVPRSLTEFAALPQFNDAVAAQSKRWRTPPDALRREWLDCLAGLEINGSRPKDSFDYLFIFEAIRRALEAG
jgi:transcriptional regulator with XRE-family HTH domain